MNPLFETLLLNNEAVTLFHANECLSRVADAYQKSLCNIRNILRENPSMESSSLHPVIIAPEQRSFHASSMAVPLSSTASMQLHSNFYLFQRALFLNAPIFPDVSCEQGIFSSPQEVFKALPVFGSVVLFNTAILCHKNATLTGESSSWEQAQQLYKASLLFATSQGATNPTDWLISVAASNNLAQIAYEKGMIDEVNDRLDHLSFLISKGGSLEQLHAIFAVEEIQGFLSNAAMAGGFKSSPAA